MPILYNVRGYWRENRGTNFKSKDYWDGKMLLQDDGWFEGIAHDPESSYTGDRFIFGVCHEAGIMEIYKFCPLAIASPFVYSISRRDDALRGDVFWLRDQHLYPFGDALISRSQVDPERVDVNSEIKELEESIEEYKDVENFSDFVSRYYSYSEVNPELVKYKQSDQIIDDLDAFIENYISNCLLLFQLGYKFYFLLLCLFCANYIYSKFWYLTLY